MNAKELNPVWAPVYGWHVICPLYPPDPGDKIERASLEEVLRGRRWAMNQCLVFLFEALLAEAQGVDLRNPGPAPRAHPGRGFWRLIMQVLLTWDPMTLAINGNRTSVITYEAMLLDLYPLADLLRSRTPVADWVARRLAPVMIWGAAVVLAELGPADLRELQATLLEETAAL